MPGISSPSSRLSRPSRPAPAVRRSARRSTKGRKQSPALLIGTVTVGVGVAITVSFVCDAFTARRSDFVAPISTNLSSPDSVAPPSPSAPPTGTARPDQARAQAPDTRATADTPPAATSSTTPSASPPAAPSTPGGPPANRPSPPRDRTRPTDRPGLALGSTGREVADLQRRLQQLQLYLGSADGNFTAAVEIALIRYQKARNIPEESGVYGPLTRAALRAETESTDRDHHRNGNSSSRGRPDRNGESGRSGDAYPYR
ncbi:peptidoglycan-binding domain-containing protein [Streptomyces sp. NPDC001108]